MKRLVSKKSEKMLDNLILETVIKLKKEKEMGTDWVWANNPIDESETESCIKDMLRLIESKAEFLERDKELNIISSEKAEIRSDAIKIVRKYLNRRYATYKETL